MRIPRVFPMIVVASILASLTPHVTHASSIDARRIARHKITIVLVEGPGRHRWKISRTEIAEMLKLTDQYWSRLSQDRIRLELKRVVSWKRTPSARSCSASIARAIGRQIGYRPGIDGHLVALQALSDPDQCPGRAGEAEIGGRYIWVGTPEWSVLAHEFGHNLGLTHTNSPGCSTGPFRLCSNTKDMASGFAEYGGRDLMGWGAGILPAPDLVALGLVKKSRVATMNLATAKDTTVTLAPLSSGQGTVAVRLRWKKTEVWLSYDISDGYTNGIQVHTVRSWRVFELPVDTFGAVKATGLLAGGTYPLPRGRVTVNSIGDSAELTFNFGTLPNVKVVPGQESAEVNWDASSLPPDDDLVVRVFSPTVEGTPPGVELRPNPVVLSTNESTVKAGAGHLTITSLSASTIYRVSIFHNGESISASQPFQVLPDSARYPEWTVDTDGGLSVSFTPSSNKYPIVYADVTACHATRVGKSTRYQTMHQAIEAGEVADLGLPATRTKLTARIHFEDGTVLEQVLIKSSKVGNCNPWGF